VFLIEVQQSIGFSRYPKESDGRESLGEYERVVVRLRVVCDRVSEPEGKAAEFTVLEHVLQRATSNIDGRWLGSLDIFDKRTPSVENLARFIFKKVEILMEHLGARPQEVILELPRERQVIYRG